MPATQIDRIDGLTTSVAVKAPVRVVATSPISFVGTAPYGYQTIDGVSVSDNISTPDLFPDRVLLVGQSDATQNGIWQVSSLAWTRALDFDGARDAVKGTFCYINEGALYANSTWKLTTPNPVIFGTSTITFALVFTALTSLAGGAVIYFSTTAALMIGIPLATVLTDGQLAQTAGRTLEGDSGGGSFYYKASDTTSSDNGGTIRVDGAGRRWYFNGRTPSVKLFGAIGDGATDDTVALQTFINVGITSTTVNGLTKFNAIAFDPGTYKITGSLLIPNDAWLFELDGANCKLVQQTDNVPCFQVTIAANNSNPQNINFKRLIFSWKNNQPAANTRAIGISFTTAKLSSNGVTGWWLSSFTTLEIQNGYYLIGRDPNSTGNAIVWESTWNFLIMANQTSGGLLNFPGGANIGGSPNNKISHCYAFAAFATAPTFNIGEWGNMSIDRYERNQGGTGSVPAPALIQAITCDNLSITNGHIETETWTGFAGINSGLIEVDGNNTVIDQLEVIGITVNPGAGNFVSLFRSLTTGSAPVEAIISGIHAQASAQSEPITFTSGSLVVAQSAGPGHIRLRPPFGIPQDAAYAGKFIDCDSGTVPFLDYDNVQTFTFYKSSVPATATTALVTGPVASTTYLAPFGGRIVSISAVLTANLTAGGMAFEPLINGSVVGAGAVNATVATSSNLASGPASYFNGIISGTSNVFAKGDQISAQVITSAANTGLDATVQIGVVFNK